MIALYNKDCFEGMKSIEPNSVKLVLTDPPFKCTDIWWDSKNIDLENFKMSLRKCCDKKALLVCFSLQPFTSYLITTFKKCFKYIIYWNKKRKTGFLNAKKVPLRQVEEIIIMKIFQNASKQTYNPQLIKRDKPTITKSGESKLYIPRGRFQYGIPIKNEYIYPTNLIQEVVEPSKEKMYFHPTQKPLKLVEMLIKTYSNEGDLVLDPFSGSATTAVACINTNRNFIGFELQPEYFEKAIERIEIAKQLKTVGSDEIIERLPILKPKKDKRQLYLF